MSGSRSQSVRPFGRRMALLLLAAFLSGLLQPLIPTPPVAAQSLSPSTQAPRAEIVSQRPAPVVESAPALASAQQTGLVNVAQGKKATQTNDNPSVLNPYPGGPPANAVDGNTNGVFANGSLIHTWGNNHDPLDWWEVDLGGSYPISKIDIWNRTDCCSERLNNFYVLVSDVPFLSNDLPTLLAQPTTSAYFTPSNAPVTTSITVGRSGRYVRVVLSQRGILSLAEVQVWSSQSTPTPGTTTTNVAQGKATVQSSTYPDGQSFRAADGYVLGNYTAKSVTHTNAGAQEWWQVDLGGVYPIDTIDVWNRTDCCSERLNNFFVFVSDTPFPTNDPSQLRQLPTVGSFFTPGNAPRRTTLAINRTGRYVRVALSGTGVLSLAEVQVWSARPTALTATPKDPLVVARTGDRSAVLAWQRVAGAASYVVRRASSPTGTYTQLSPTVTQPLSGTLNSFSFADAGLANETLVYYTVTALNSSGATVSTSEVITARPSATIPSAFTPLRAASFNAHYGMRAVSDGVLGRNVMTGIDSGDNLTFSNVNFDTGANGAALRYSASGSTRGTLLLLTHPANQLLATFPITTTNGAWTQATTMITRTQGIQSVYLNFVGEGGDNLRIDELVFSAPGPYDTATVKWDPNLVLLHKSMGITLASFAFDAASGTMLFTFNASTAQGQGQLAKLKAGSMIASDTNLDLGGPYGRVQQVVTLSATQAAVKVTATDYTQMIYGGSYDVGAAAQQALNSALQAAVGTSALGPGYTTAGYNTTFPSNINYYSGTSLTGGATASNGGAQLGSGRVAGLGARTAQSEVPAISLPPEAKNAPKGTFHVTMDNAQFIYDEDGWGIELVNLRMNGLGIVPGNPIGPKTNPVANQFGFGVLGGVGFDTLRIQFLAQIQNGNIARNQMFTFKTGVTAKAHFQTKGLAVALWFWEVPDKWLKGINFVVPTTIGPIPCSMVFGVQGFIMAVGAGQMTIEKGYQGRLRPGEPLNQLAQLTDYGDTKFDFGQRVDNTSLAGLFGEPFVKVRVGTFGVSITDPAIVDPILRWMSFGLKIPYEQLKKMEGFVVLTFTLRLYGMVMAQNWKDKDRPIFQAKACVGPFVKAEALPGFPLPMTFELRLEGPPFCLWHKNWLYYDMKVPSGVQADPNTSEATIGWGVPVESERSSIPYTLKFYGPFPYSEAGGPKVESTNIADALLNGATRRRCVLFRKPRSSSDTIDIAYDGPCQANLNTKVRLPSGVNTAVYVLRVLTEYRTLDWYSNTATMIRDLASGGNLLWGIWSDKEIVVYRQKEITRFEVNTTQVYSDSVRTMDAIESTVCDITGRYAKDMRLFASVAPADPALAEVISATLEVDGLGVPSERLPGIDPNTWQLSAAPKLDLLTGAHSMAINAQLRLKGSSTTYTTRVVATFKVQAVSCGRARPDEFHAVIYEGGVCAQQTTPFSPLDVLGNDDWTNVQLELVSVQGANKGQAQLSPDKQTVLYKPTAVGVDTFTYTIKDTKTQTVLVGNGSVLVNNRRATSESDCSNGGGGSGGNANGRGKISNWGDPHITTADGVQFDSHALGEFIYLRPRSGKSGLTVHGRQQYYQSGKFPAITTALAFRIGSSTVEIRANQVPYLLVNSNPTNLSTLDLGDGSSLTIGTDNYQINSPTMSILVQRQGSYLDTNITLPLNGTYEGMWGTPNGSRADDMALPSGVVTTDTLKLADGWRITDRTLSLFTYASGQGPETFNQPNLYLGQMPTATALAPYVQQAQNLLTNTCDTAGVTPDATKINALALELYIGTSANSVASQLCSYQLSGQISTTNPAGVPVVGARVAITSAQTQPCTTVTDTQGRYRCSLAPLPGATVPSLQISVAGLAAQTFTFPSKPRTNSTAEGILNLSVVRPTLRLTVRTLNETGASLPNTTVEVQSSAFQKQVTTDANGAVALTLTYEPGTSSTFVNIKPIFPARGPNVYQTVTLNTAGSVDATVELKALVLNIPSWRALGSGLSDQEFGPVDSDTDIAVGPDGTIYSISSFNNGQAWGNQLTAYDPSGVRKWTSETTFDAPNATAPVIGPDGTIYVLGLTYPNTYLYAFYPDGSLRWRYKSVDEEYVTSPVPAIGADGTIYLVMGPSAYGTTTLRLYSFDPSTGRPRWSYAFQDVTPKSSPVVGADGTIYVPGTKLRLVNPDGTLKNTTSFSTRSDGQLVLGANGSIYIIASGNGESTSSWTTALNADLTERWSKGVGNTTVIGTDGALYMLASPGLIKLNPATGETMWSYSARTYSAPVVSTNGTIHLLVDTSVGSIAPTSQIVGLRPDGMVASRFVTDPSSTRRLTMGKGGTIYIRAYGESNAYDLWAIPTSSNGPAAGWSSAWGNPQNTGRRMP